MRDGGAYGCAVPRAYANLNPGLPTGSRSSSPDRFLPVLSSQEPTQRRPEKIPFVAIDPRPDPEELSHAQTS